MKRHICAALAAALLMPGVLASGARAQDDAPPQPSERAGQAPKGNPMAARMKEKLGLTDEQSAKFQDAMKSHGDAMKAQGEKMKEAVKKLQDAVKAKAKDDEILADLAALKALRKDMMADNEKFEESLASFLTPTQRAKMALGMARMMHRRREEMRDRKGGDDRGGDARGEKRGGGDRDGDEDHDGDHEGPQEDGGGQ